MKVSLATHGGHLAGMTARRPPQIVDSGALPRDAAEELARLVAGAKAAVSAGDSRPELTRDAMAYPITIEDGDRDLPLVLTQWDGTMSPAFAALRNWIRVHCIRN
jgi:hypothetical protein